MGGVSGDRRVSMERGQSKRGRKEGEEGAMRTGADVGGMSGESRVSKARKVNRDEDMETPTHMFRHAHTHTHV